MPTYRCCAYQRAPVLCDTSTGHTVSRVSVAAKEKAQAPWVQARMAEARSRWGPNEAPIGVGPKWHDGQVCGKRSTQTGLDVCRGPKPKHVPLISARFPKSWQYLWNLTLVSVSRWPSDRPVGPLDPNHGIWDLAGKPLASAPSTIRKAFQTAVSPAHSLHVGTKRLVLPVKDATRRNRPGSHCQLYSTARLTASAA